MAIKIPYMPQSIYDRLHIAGFDFDPLYFFVGKWLKAAIYEVAFRQVFCSWYSGLEEPVIIHELPERQISQVQD